jgi:hypothetical protein
MVRIAVDLGWAPFVAFGQQTDAIALHRHAGGKVERATRDDLLGLTDVRDDFFLGLLEGKLTANEA